MNYRLLLFEKILLCLKNFKFLSVLIIDLIVMFSYLSYVFTSLKEIII